MHHSTLLLSSALFASHAFGQWTSNPLVNTTVRDGNGVTAATPLMTDGPNGGTYISWFDQQSTGYQLRMQLLDADGMAQWPIEGSVVSDHPQNTALFRYDLKTDHAGNALVAFQDERTGQLDIVVYKVSPAGDMLWGTDGIALTDPASTGGLAPAIGVLANNDVIIAWSADNATDKWVAYQWISADGTPQWATPHQIPGPANYSRPDLVGTSDGGYILQYVEETGNFPFICNMYAQRYSADGVAQWPAATHVSTKTISFFFFPELTADGHDGYYLSFNTGNPGNAALTDVYVQRVKSDGSTWSATGTEAITGTSTQRYGGHLAVINDPMGLMVPVQVTNTAQSAGGINVQRLDTAGVVQLGSSGAEVVAQSAQLPSPDGVASTGDGCIVVYSEGGFGQEHLRAARVGVAGDLVWNPALVDLCSTNSNKDDAACSRFGNNGQVVTVWQDDRLSSGVYAQNITGDGDLGIITSIAEGAGAAQGLSVWYSEGQIGAQRAEQLDGPAMLQIMDLSGRVLVSRTITLANGRVSYPLTPLPRACYLLEIRAMGTVERTRFVTH